MLTTIKSKHHGIFNEQVILVHLDAVFIGTFEMGDWPGWRFKSSLHGGLTPEQMLDVAIELIKFNNETLTTEN